MVTISQRSKIVSTRYIPSTIHRGGRAMKKMQALVIGFILVIGLLTGSDAMAQETALSAGEVGEFFVALFGGGDGLGGPTELTIRQEDGVVAMRGCNVAACLCTGLACADLFATGRCGQGSRCVEGVPDDPSALCICVLR